MENSELFKNMIFSSNQIKMELSQILYKYQPHSIKINYQANAILKIKRHIPFQPFISQGKDQKRDAFCFWIYQKQRQKGKLKFIFEKNGKDCCSFSFGLNFIGWRTAWVIYERDMQGIPKVDMDGLRIEFPDQIGSLYLTDIQFGAKIDPRHPTPDMQAPQVNPHIGASGHWMRLNYFEESRQNEKLKFQPLSHYNEIDIQEDTKKIWNRQEKYLLEKYQIRQLELSYDDIKSKWDQYKLCVHPEGLIGVSVDSRYTMEILPIEQRKGFIEQGISIDMHQTGELLLDLALLFRQHKSNQIAQQYTQLSRHLLNQGLAYGSSLGTTHHYGYVLKTLFESIFLMVDYLKNNNPKLLQDLVEMTIWITGLGRIEVPKVEDSINVDVLNTYSLAMLMAVLLEKDLSYRHHLLVSFSQWLNISIDYAKGLEGTFKPDGSMYHHCNHYPAYGLDGLKSLTPLIYFLAGTFAEISDQAYQIVENAMEKLRWYCNLKHWPTPLSARHPKTDGEHTHLTSNVFYYMCLAEMISKKKPNMGNIYLRLEGDLAYSDVKQADLEVQTRIKELKAKGYHAEATPNGHLTMNWACAGFHRRGEWLAAIRGHNRYLWSHESYVANNLYGRYISFNHLQILSQGHPITLKSNGYQAEGFDWNCFSGTTVIKLPFSDLKSKVYNVDEYSGYEEMLLTDEYFAGGVTLGENGMFAMKLHEHPKYDGSHRAILSSFFFGDTIIRLASDIENTDQEHPTITTLFQSLTTPTPFWLNGEAKQDNMMIKDSTEMVISDGYQNSYWVLSSNPMEIKTGMQYSPAQNNEEEKSGDFTKAVLCHGKAPVDEEYEYVVGVNYLPQDFYQQVKKWQAKPFYKVYQKDQQAHIIEHFPSHTFAYALFEAGVNQNENILKSWQRPCLLMIQQDSSEIHMSFCDVDLRLYEGRDEGQYDETGQQIECSVYSRQWIHTESIGKETKIVLNGLFEVKSGILMQQDADKTRLQRISHNIDKKETTLEFWGVQGGEVEIELVPIR